MSVVTARSARSRAALPPPAASSRSHCSSAPPVRHPHRRPSQPGSNCSSSRAGLFQRDVGRSNLCDSRVTIVSATGALRDAGPGQSGRDQVRWRRHRTFGEVATWRAIPFGARRQAASSDVAGERPAVADTVFTERARYFDSSNAFALKYPPVPCHQFLAERDRALDPATGTAIIPLDLSDRLETRVPGHDAPDPDQLPADPRRRPAVDPPQGERRAVLCDRGIGRDQQGARCDPLGPGRRVLPAGRRRDDPCGRRARTASCG